MRFSGSAQMDPINAFGDFDLDRYEQEVRRRSLSSHLQRNTIQTSSGSTHSLTTRPTSDLDLRRLSDHFHQYSRWHSTSSLTENSREEPKTPIKRAQDIILEHLSSKRLRSSDPFSSPNPLMKDFRLSSSSSDPKESCDSDPFFCRFCNVSAPNLKELAQHLRGKRHQKNFQPEEESESINRSKASDPSDNLQRLLSQSKQNFIGLDQIRPHMDDRTRYYCLLCDCNRLPALNLIQHIKGSKHKHNFMSSRFSENKRSVCSTSSSSRPKSLGAFSHDMSGSKSSKQSYRRYRSDVSKCNSKEVLVQSESKSETDSLKKTIENFKSIRNICDQMIEFYSEREKSSLIGSDVTVSVPIETSAETRVSMQIKKEK